jgi:hypothetical protein
MGLVVVLTLASGTSLLVFVSVSNRSPSGIQAIPGASAAAMAHMVRDGFVNTNTMFTVMPQVI